MKHRFMRAHLIRLSRLMDMMYKPSEIAEEIGVTADTVYRSYLPGGCPFTRDTTGEIWIHGLSFAAWVRQVYDKNKPARLEDGQAWCLVCHKAVPLSKPHLRYTNRYIKIYQGKCELCGTKINRAYAASSNLEGVKS